MKQLCESKNSRIRARGNMLKTDAASMDRYRTFFEGQFNNNCTGAEPFRKGNFTNHLQIGQNISRNGELKRLRASLALDVLEVGQESGMN